ncbi:MAG TPA: metallophosphoesterase [Candidatus Paceibacterota bacterium]|nr:metallophosphoesterase [Verrucomicrobiota bacterium]HSA09875.1 metallophosphoesterase [Candidatus Paceibacterota bacterium]
MNLRRLAAAILCLGSAGLPAAEPFFFVQLADPQFGMFTENKDFAQETANLEFAVATINRLRPAFVVVSGDLVNQPGDAAQIGEYRRIMSRVGSNIPVYQVAGNHDIGNTPSPADIATYTNHFGPDHYTFQRAGFVGIVLNSGIIHTPTHTARQLAEQESWLQAELKRARQNGARHIVIFAHHPWFLKAADEPDEYFNIPGERRARYLAWFREAGVKHLFSGHTHRNVIARDGGLESVATGPVGKPLVEGKSGLRIVIVRDGRLEHRFYHFGELPNRIDLGAAEQRS